MKILALEHETPAAQADLFKQHGRAEAARAWELVQSGVIREMYFAEPAHTAVLILECPGLDEARAALATLPFVQHGLITFEVTALAPYSGFARLFAANQ